MSIPSSAKARPIASPSDRLPVIGGGGAYAIDELRRQNHLRDYVVGMGRIIPCSCISAANVLTLTPNGHGAEDGVGPLLEGYRFGDIYLFVADASSTGSVTATVVPKSGALATLKVYINGGAAQAGNGDITAGRVYLGVYVYSLDANAGGIVIRHP
jgi:hypothetical protein